MNNSHWLGLTGFGVCAFFAVLMLVSRKKTGLSQRGTIVGAVAFVMLGVVMGGGAFLIDNQMRITTLHEEVIPGSMGQKPDTPAPLRKVTFAIEHPQIGHTLTLWPESDATPDFTAKLHIRLVNGQGATLLEAEPEYEPQLGSGRNPRVEWDTQSYSFVPQRAETFTLYVTPITTDIPRVHVYITDPQKRNGVRLPGY
jgi:hypothetical protein